MHTHSYAKNGPCHTREREISEWIENIEIEMNSRANRRWQMHEEAKNEVTENGVARIDFFLQKTN